MQGLSNILSVFKVDDVVLMPRATLPILIKKTLYEKMHQEIIDGNTLAVVQPIPSQNNKHTSYDDKQIFKTGCAGRIVNITNMGNDTAVFIKGVCRFDIVDTVSTADNIMKVEVDYSRYIVDMQDVEDDNRDPEELIKVLSRYFKDVQLPNEWKNDIEQCNVYTLLSALTMACNLHPIEKQSLLETIDIKERSQMIAKIIEMNSHNVFVNEIIN